MIGGTAIPWDHGNAQTYISYALTFGESEWTLAKLLMTRWHELSKLKCGIILVVRGMEYSISEILKTFDILWYFFNQCHPSCKAVKPLRHKELQDVEELEAEILIMSMKRKE